MKEYSLVIASNFLDHYMYALSVELKKYFKDFYFVASEELEQQYQKLGFADLNNSDFVVKAYEDKDRAQELVMNADIVITGSYKYMSHIRKRLAKKKMVVYYSERLFKNDNPVGTLLRHIKYFARHGFDSKSPLLCVSAYTAGDYNKVGVFKNRTYKWGYFPNVKQYDDIDAFISNKKENSLFWAGRLIEWKHPDDAIKVARKLKDDGYSFTLNIAGNGPLEETLKKMIVDNDLANEVKMLGSMPPEKIRENMEASEIYLFTSDKGEGWGVVLNEALNSACATLASYSAGSTPFLVEDKVNGVLYKHENIDELYEGVKYLLDNRDEANKIRKNAYNSICSVWNSNQAAERFYEFAVKLMNNEDTAGLYENGILSPAFPIE